MTFHSFLCVTVYLIPYNCFNWMWSWNSMKGCLFTATMSFPVIFQFAFIFNYLLLTFDDWSEESWYLIPKTLQYVLPETPSTEQLLLEKDLLNRQAFALPYTISTLKRSFCWSFLCEVTAASYNQKLFYIDSICWCHIKHLRCSFLFKMQFLILTFSFHSMFNQ